MWAPVTTYFWKLSIFFELWQTCVTDTTTVTQPTHQKYPLRLRPCENWHLAFHQVLVQAETGSCLLGHVKPFFWPFCNSCQGAHWVPSCSWRCQWEGSSKLPRPLLFWLNSACILRVFSPPKCHKPFLFSPLLQTMQQQIQDWNCISSLLVSAGMTFYYGPTHPQANVGWHCFWKECVRRQHFRKSWSLQKRKKVCRTIHRKGWLSYVWSKKEKEGIGEMLQLEQMPRESRSASPLPSSSLLTSTGSPGSQSWERSSMHTSLLIFFFPFLLFFFRFLFIFHFQFLSFPFLSFLFLPFPFCSLPVPSLSSSVQGPGATLSDPWPNTAPGASTKRIQCYGLTLRAWACVLFVHTLLSPSSMHYEWVKNRLENRSTV